MAGWALGRVFSLPIQICICLAGVPDRKIAVIIHLSDLLVINLYPPRGNVWNYLSPGSLPTSGLCVMIPCNHWNRNMQECFQEFLSATLYNFTLTGIQEQATRWWWGILWWHLHNLLILDLCWCQAQDPSEVSRVSPCWVTTPGTGNHVQSTINMVMDPWSLWLLFMVSNRL